MAGARPKGPVDTQLVLQVLDGLADMEDPGSFGRSALKALASVVPFDIGSFNEVDPTNRRAVFCAYPQYSGVEADVARFPQLVQQNPILQYQHRTGDGSAHRLSDFMELDEVHQLDLYQHIYRPLGIEYQVAIGLIVKTPLVVAFALNRRASDFADQELVLLDTLRPYLSQSYRNVQAMEALQGMDSALAEMGAAIVVLDGTGLQVRVSPWARDILEYHFGSFSESDLPGAVVSWIGEERRELFSDGRPRIHRPLVRALGDNQVVLRFVPGGGVRPDVVALDERRGERAVAELTRLGLTQREAQILHLLMRGESVSGAASAIGVTTATLNKHLEHIYRKLGVGSRSAAVAAASDALFGAR